MTDPIYQVSLRRSHWRELVFLLDVMRMANASVSQQAEAGELPAEDAACVEQARGTMVVANEALGALTAQLAALDQVHALSKREVEP